jgi:hypothetical protein
MPGGAAIIRSGKLAWPESQRSKRARRSVFGASRAVARVSSIERKVPDSAAPPPAGKGSRLLQAN